MNILLLAPEPFFQERGTPIAVALLLRVLSAAGCLFDVVTLPEGEDFRHSGVTIHRAGPAWLGHVRPGFSSQKLLADVFVFSKAAQLARHRPYDVVHAVEESVFAAWLPSLRRLPFVYDMDSSLSQQLVESRLYFRPLRPVFEWFERAAVRRAAAVLAVCEGLAERARRFGARHVTVLRDISLLEEFAQPADVNLREGVPPNAFLFLYVGNLEPYQGVDLLLESLSILKRSLPGRIALAVVGGTPAAVHQYRQKAAELGVAEVTRFVGPKPIAMLKTLLNQADALVSPRTRGHNTPMKIYSYLDSGKPVVATAIPSHTEVLDDSVAFLAPPEPRAFAAAMHRAVMDSELRQRIAMNAQALAASKYRFASYQETLLQFYRDLERRLRTAPQTAACA